MKVISGIKVYEVEDLVELLRLNRVTVQKMLREGRIKGVKFGKRWHVTEDNLKDFLTGKSSPG
jgi:excisionase family DNA binding protein